MHTQCRDIRTALFDQLLISVTHGMWHSDKWQRVVADAFGGDLRQRCKRGAHHCYCRDARCFEFGRVTRGPGG